MTFRKEVTDRALQLASENNSAEKVANLLEREFPNDYPCSRTVRLWIEREKRKKEEASPENIERKRQHNIRVFTDSDAIMSEEKLKIFLWPLDGGPPIYYYDKAKNVGEYLHFFSLEGNQYLDPELKQLNHSLCDALRELGTFLHDEFRTPNRISHGDEKYARLIPGELSHMHYFGEQDMEDDKRYWDYFKQLQILNKNCERCLERYRAHIRDTLFI